ncbi:hypothetical protein [Paenibacillus andongensis]|uniref:hypothetical protein n=1 Tax=Paenibacillus andongensis TaxID=2975482 RepID=UPI0021BB8FE3|nr:hypothetical protein [Paenibacillus andongensis]
MKRFTIKTNGVLKTLFTVVELKSNDLNIQFPGQKQVRIPKDTFQELINTDASEMYLPYRGQHISIHNSPQSVNTNTIKRTIEFTETEKLPYYNITPGLKRDNLFVPVIFRVCGDFVDSSYNYIPKNKYHHIELPFEFNPLSDQLRFMLVVSGNEREFHFDDEHPSNVYSERFNNFYITIIYSIFNRPSKQHSINMYLTTKQEQVIPPRGFECWEIYNLYTEMNTYYINHYFNQLEVNENIL